MAEHFVCIQVKGQKVHMMNATVYGQVEELLSAVKTQRILHMFALKQTYDAQLWGTRTMEGTMRGHYSRYIWTAPPAKMFCLCSFIFFMNLFFAIIFIPWGQSSSLLIWHREASRRPRGSSTSSPITKNIQLGRVLSNKRNPY